MTATILDTRLKAIEELIWHVVNTPLHFMLRLSPEKGTEIYTKLEWQQFGGSLKVAQSIDEGVVITVLPDDARKYGSMNLEA